MQAPAQQSIRAKLKRIEGQVRGILGMVEEGRYCVDILVQTSAVRAALQRVEKDILKNHASTCVAGAFRSGNAREQRSKIDELVTVLSEINK